MFHIHIDIYIYIYINIYLHGVNRHMPQKKQIFAFLNSPHLEEFTLDQLGLKKIAFPMQRNGLTAMFLCQDSDYAWCIVIWCQPTVCICARICCRPTVCIRTRICCRPTVRICRRIWRRPTVCICRNIFRIVRRIEHSPCSGSFQGWQCNHKTNFSTSCPLMFPYLSPRIPQLPVQAPWLLNRKKTDRPGKVSRV